jgi:hypothetical protein
LVHRRGVDDSVSVVSSSKKWNQIVLDSRLVRQGTQVIQIYEHSVVENLYGGAIVPGAQNICIGLMRSRDDEGGFEPFILILKILSGTHTVSELSEILIRPKVSSKVGVAT